MKEGILTVHTFTKSWPWTVRQIPSLRPWALAHQLFFVTCASSCSRLTSPRWWIQKAGTLLRIPRQAAFSPSSLGLVGSCMLDGQTIDSRPTVNAWTIRKEMSLKGVLRLGTKRQKRRKKMKVRVSVLSLSYISFLPCATINDGRLRVGTGLSTCWT